MATVPRGFHILPRSGRRCIASSAFLCSGHNRWSKIKHDKGKEDAAKTKVRSTWSLSLMQASKDHGPDPNSNARLATLIAGAKKSGFPKSSIENAIARGQGLSPTGAALEMVTVEAMLSSMAVIIECQTDSKARTLQDLRNLIKECGGSVTPTNHLFERRGKIILEKAEGVEEEEMFDQAIEAGAVDVDVGDDARILIFSEPHQTAATAAAMRASGHEIESSEIIWTPKVEVKVDTKSANTLASFIGKLQDDPSVQNVFANTS
ncbi:hypothetical protein MMC12_003417 [Toensbergia leucococca]|nr:hypothetical protein [Toensbergia leucococca]